MLNRGLMYTTPDCYTNSKIEYSHNHLYNTLELALSNCKKIQPHGKGRIEEDGTHGNPCTKTSHVQFDTRNGLLRALKGKVVKGKDCAE